MPDRALVILAREPGRRQRHETQLVVVGLAVEAPQLLDDGVVHVAEHGALADEGAARVAVAVVEAALQQLRVVPGVSPVAADGSSQRCALVVAGRPDCQHVVAAGQTPQGAW